MPAAFAGDRVPAASRWPRARALGLALVPALLALTVSAAAAEKVRTTGSTKVYKRTGEQSAVVTRVEKDTTLQVLATQGRWLKVRVNGRTGWVTRASVISLNAALPRNTRRRPFVDGRSLGRDDAGDAPDDRVGADAVDGEGDGREVRGGDDRDDRDDQVRVEVRKPARGDDRDDDRRKPAREPADRDDDRRKPNPEPDDRARERGEDAGDDDTGRDAGDDAGDDDGDTGPPVLTVRSAEAPLYPRPSRDADALRTLRAGDEVVLLEEHRSGRWLRVELPDGDEVGYIAVEDVARPDPTGPAGRTIAASARLGFASIGGDFHSDGAMLGAGPPPDYPFRSAAISLALGAEATFPIARRFLVGGSARYLGCLATPGIAFAGESVGFTTHDIDLLAVGGYDLRHARGITVWARAGLHVGRFSVSDLANKARLPVETVLGPMVGTAVRVRRVTPKVGAEASFDVMPTARRAQTKNQADGQLAATRSIWLQLAVTYAWRPSWRVEAGYQLGYAGSRWVGPSDRHMSATGATRTDLAHVLGVGIARPF